MKLTVGGFRGKPIPKVFNPFIFVLTAVVVMLGAAMMILVAALLLVYTPFSWLSTVRVSD